MSISASACYVVKWPTTDPGWGITPDSGVLVAGWSVQCKETRMKMTGLHRSTRMKLYVYWMTQSSLVVVPANEATDTRASRPPAAGGPRT